MAGQDADIRYLQVQTTTDSRAEAMELSRAAVESRLAACAQVAGPVASMYWWDGALERTEEWLVLLKLPADRYDELAAFIDSIERRSRPLVDGWAGFQAIRVVEAALESARTGAWIEIADAER